MPDRIDGSRLRALRERNRMTLEALAARSGLHSSTIWKIEKEWHSTVRYETTRRLARALGASEDELFAGGGDGAPGGEATGLDPLDLNQGQPRQPE